MPATGFVKRPRAAKKHSRSTPWANGAIEVQVYPFVPVDSEAEPHKASAAVILETDWLSTGRSVLGVGRMMLPAAPSALAAAGIGDAQITGITLAKSSRGRVRIEARREVQLAGVTLASNEVDLRGSELHRAVASLVFANRLFKGSGEAVRDALHGWAVLAHWDGDPLAGSGSTPQPPPQDEEEWLAARLATLGVESAGDLELLESSDLLPDLEEVTGVASWAAQPVLEGLPRLWKHGGGLYSCSVLPGLKTVQLEPVDAKARKLKEPRAAALPRWHGFRVTFKQGSRRLALR